MGAFHLWPMQVDALNAIASHNFVIVLKARQLGLTWLVLAYALHKILYHPGFLAIAISKRDDPDAIELGNRMQFMLRYLPPWLIQAKPTRQNPLQPVPWFSGRTWSADAHEITIQHPTGEDARFLTLPASPDTAHSFTADLVINDEWALHPWAEEIWTGAFPTINRPDYSGQVIGLSTGRRGTLFDRLWDGATKGSNSFQPIFLPWWADPHRTPKWREQTTKNLPNTHLSQYPATPEEAFAAGEGAFFPEWSAETHVIKDTAWYPPSYCELHGAYDAGYGSRACFKWYAVFPSGEVVCYREYYPHAVTDPEQAKEIKAMSVDPNGRPEHLVSIRADPSCWNKQSGTGESTGEIFARHGLYMMKADNDLSNGWRRLHQWLKPVDTPEGPLAWLRFTWNCANTIRTYPACMQKKSNPEDIDNGSEHHPQDVDRYFVMGRPAISESDSFLPGSAPGSRYPKGRDFDTEDDDDKDPGEAGQGWFGM